MPGTLLAMSLLFWGWHPVSAQSCECLEPGDSLPGWLPPIALRRDRALGIGVTPAAFDLGQFGYLAARINGIPSASDISFEAMVTTSASQFFSWYVSAGAGWEHDLVEIEILGERFKAFGNPEWKFVTEFGVEFRARVPGK